MKMKDEVQPGPPAPAAAARRPGRPRSDQAEEAILDAVFTLFSEGATFDALSMEMIAGEAKVGKATIYRRWPNKEALVIDAICRRLHPDAEKFAPPGASVREDLIFLLEKMRRHLQEESSGSAYNVLTNVGKANPLLYRRYHEVVIEPRRDLYRRVLQRGIATGELRADLDVERTMLILTSTMLNVTRHPLGDPVGREFSVGLTDDLLRGAAPRSTDADAVRVAGVDKPVKVKRGGTEPVSA
ncbi:TetR/AcrR family transcriptional regulator [Actinocrinis sp.]|uniref:TetR/AcrR family transcriptional regulator n=1 Tax=Actinocrinis sp. TaxID=1920516 RepID=UPI002B515B88|nr:TetR/AcrR family transcriptional regulator [Actinocrinis sp.]HXR74257.1 TetR/AcrR family transcriptional regulator [Actinocrinis sp.]